MAALRADEPPAVLVDDPDSGQMPRLLEALISQAAARKPRLAARTRGSLVLRATDVPAAGTVRFQGTQIVVSAAATSASMMIEGDARALAELAAGGYGLRALATSTAQVHGLIRHPLFALRVWRLLAASRARA